MKARIAPLMTSASMMAIIRHANAATGCADGNRCARQRFIEPRSLNRRERALRRLIARLAANEEPDRFEVVLLGRKGAHDPTFIDDGDAVGEIEQLFELLGN